MADAEYRPKSVKDVPAEKFIKAFAAYLKQTNKARQHREQQQLEGGGGSSGVAACGRAAAWMQPAAWSCRLAAGREQGQRHSDSRDAASLHQQAAAHSSAGPTSLPSAAHHAALLLLRCSASSIRRSSCPSMWTT